MEIIRTKSGQVFEPFNSFEEAITAVRELNKKEYNYTILIEYETGEEYIKDGNIIEEGEYKETGIKTLLLNSEKGKVQMYGNYHITDVDTGEKYSVDKDVPYRLWNASTSNHYIFPAYQIASYIY